MFFSQGSEANSSKTRSMLNEGALKVSGKFKGWCHNIHDGKILKSRGESNTKTVMKACAKQCTTVQGCPNHTATRCVIAHTGLGYRCAWCFGGFIQCSDDHCIEECTCGSSKDCDACNRKNCKPKFDSCSGCGGHDTSFTLDAELDDSEGEHSLVLVV